MKSTLRFGFPVLLLLAATASLPTFAQDWVHTGSGLGNAPIRLAAADFKLVGADPQTPALKATFDSTLFNDLQNSGIFTMVSKSLAPQASPGSPQEINLSQWSADPSAAAMVAFGALSATNGRLVVYGWLDDTRNTANPQVLGKQYNEAASEEMARTIAHRFADEIIYRLGGGINGIAETKLYFISSRTGSKEVWAMDYDGQNQHAITHLGTVSLSPRISPDNSRIAFSSLDREGWAIKMYSIDLGRMVSFPAGKVGGSNSTPAWSSDGTKIAFSSSRSGDPEIWIYRCSRWAGAQDHLVPRTRCCTHLESAHERTDCVGQRTHRPAADLHHGPGRRQRRAPHRRRVRRFSLVVAERAMAHLCVEPQIRSRRARRPGYLRNGYLHPQVAPAHPRLGQQRLPFVVAR